MLKKTLKGTGIKMKVIAINGSPRKNGNISMALDAMAEELAAENIEAEIIQIGDQLIHGCISCGYCYHSEDHQCVFKDDLVNEVSVKIRKADGLILGSPTYFGGIAGTMKSFLDRVFYTDFGQKSLRNKVGAAVVSVRRSGGVEVFNQLHHYLSLAEMITPPSQYWCVGHGNGKGEIVRDTEGMQTIRRHANAMAWLMKTIEKGEEPLPRIEPRESMSFIR